MRRFLVAFLVLLVTPAVLAHPAPDGFADLAERLSPAVVNISAAQRLDSEDGLPEFPEGSPLERFNDIFGDAPRIANSLGSGFIIDPEGLVVTNNHVIDGADEVEVALPDGRVFAAEVVGIDPVTDLAVLRMEVNEALPHVDFGDSDTARVGDWVIAIGNPFGLGGTLTAGVVSARGRDAGGQYDDYIQTDVAINTGNSGGPLFDMAGNVVGVNTLILSPTGASVGISLSIPSNLARRVVDQLIEFGETRRGWLGVSVHRVTPELAESFGLNTPYGAIVSRIEEDGPGEAAGLRQGDLILSFDGERVQESRTFPRMVAESEIGREVEVEIIRRDRRMTLDITVGELEREGDEDAAAGSGSAGGVVDPSQGNANEVLGMTLAALDAPSRRRYRVDPDAQGVLVTDVDASSDAAGKIRPGDVIEEVEFTRVATIADIREIVSGHSGGPIRFQVNRGGQYVLHSIRP
ncbi:Do family serine endopeptidase [Maricaulis virginensis]|uniref:Probable periplasmic serine endoprotease DegP-like n=1 Tax=Maricaulis virginensis TaxID=144022 RepID=A0A9W6MMR4_9PROT|nr:Do family serine endopeptidase [Maricaulis virginensis]GLK51447.1 serine protease [Maricaulis virginensis]